MYCWPSNCLYSENLTFVSLNPLGSKAAIPGLFSGVINGLNNSYNFILCSKAPDYIPDKYSRFLDLNFIHTDLDCSLSGLLIEVMRRSILTVGSQSANPNISLLLGVPALEWGNQKILHTVDYNIKNTRVKFIEDKDYSISASEIYNQMKIFLEKVKGKPYGN